jgi:hypothetical protein
MPGTSHFTVIGSAASSGSNRVARLTHSILTEQPGEFRNLARQHPVES